MAGPGGERADGGVSPVWGSPPSAVPSGPLDPPRQGGLRREHPVLTARSRSDGRNHPPEPNHPNPTPENATEALNRTCVVCHAEKGQPCTNTITPGQPLPGREFHIGRSTDR